MDGLVTAAAAVRLPAAAFRVPARAALLLLLAAACTGDISAPRPPKIDAIAVVPGAEPLYRSLDLTLAEAAPVEITYTDGGPDTLRVVSADAAREHRITMPRLRPGTQYTYEARALVGVARGEAASGEFSTGPLPDDVASLRFTYDGTPSAPVTLLEVMISTTGFAGLVMLDRTGEVVWYWRGSGGFPMGVTRRANGNLVVQDDGRLVEVAADGSIVHELSRAGGATPYGVIHHDVVATPANSLYFIARETRETGAETVTGEALWEWFPETGAVQKRWSVFDHLSWEQDQGPESAANNWLHMNSLWLGARGNVIASLRSLDQVISIAPDFQSLEWRLGGPNATLRAEGEAAFSGQHSVVELAAGRLLMFDNGRRRESGVYSRGLEIALDPAGGRASFVREYRSEPDRFALIVGGARRLPNGNSVITWGVGGTPGSLIMEFGPGGDLLWRAEGPPTVTRIYKAIPLDAAFGESEIGR